MNRISFHNNLNEAFEARVAAAPDAEAVVCGEVRLTAAELNARANALARRLNAAGVGPESPVVVLMRRSTDVVITLLAVVKAGGTYVPLHPGLPPARMRWIAEQTRAQVVITDDTHAGHELTRHLPAMTTGPQSDPRNPDLEIDPDRLAYTMFTSGSTGVPKGVAVTHRNVMALAADRRWRDHHRVLSHSPFAFDASTYELWVPLLNGGTVVVAPPGPVDASVVRRALEEERVDAVFLTTGLFNVLAEDSAALLAKVPQLWIAGEAASPAAAQVVVLVREDQPGDRRLVAYLVPYRRAGLPSPSADAELSGQVRWFAEEALPAYMVPSAFVVMDALPLNHNGKIDRRALPVPAWQEPAAVKQPPRTEAEELVAEIWAEVLGLDRIGVHDDFFALGGNSLLAIRVVSRIRAAVDLEIPVDAVFTSPTVERLADAVEALLIADIEGRSP